MIIFMIAIDFWNICDAHASFHCWMEYLCVFGVVETLISIQHESKHVLCELSLCLIRPDSAVVSLSAYFNGWA